MTSIILVHTFSPVAGEHYTALPAEEGQPVSYVRRIVVEGSAAQALDLAGGFLREGEAVANTYGLPGGNPVWSHTIVRGGQEYDVLTDGTEVAVKPDSKPAPAKTKKSI